jgi:2-amino-4-hydroxy-6-hydroxymethyldihydropteridine diphosphokinase
MLLAMTDANTLYLSLGSNIGDRYSHLCLATQHLQAKGLDLLAQSPIYQTAALTADDAPQRQHLNQVLMMKTPESSEVVLQWIKEIESTLQRTRTKKYGPRTIDIDILFFNSESLESESLTIPHQRLHQRRFVLQPLFNIAPNLTHPVLKKTIAELLSECEDTLEVKPFYENSEGNAKNEKR